jgi:hypothetical protein
VCRQAVTRGVRYKARLILVGWVGGGKTADEYSHGLNIGAAIRRNRKRGRLLLHLSYRTPTGGLLDYSRAAPS